MERKKKKKTLPHPYLGTGVHVCPLLGEEPAGFKCSKSLLMQQVRNGVRQDIAAASRYPLRILSFRTCFVLDVVFL